MFNLFLIASIFCSLACALVPPKYPPAGLDFTLNGSVPLEYFHVDDTNNGASSHFQFPAKSIDHHIKGVNATLTKIGRMLDHALSIGHTADDVAARIPKEQWLYLALLAKFEFLAPKLTLREALVGSKVLVVGSMSPWIECLMLVIGAAEVVTIEYNTLTFEHKQLTTISHPEFGSFFAIDSLHAGTFDCIISMSSLDHDGLGRYGDPINPMADIESVDRLSRMLKPAGLFVLTVPVGPDVVVFNLHRRYGRVRLPLLLQGWETAGRLGWVESMLDQPANWRQSYEPIFVLRRNPAEPVVSIVAGENDADDAASSSVDSNRETVERRSEVDL